jgi:hypothetical protein
VVAEVECINSGPIATTEILSDIILVILTESVVNKLMVSE